LYLILSDLTRPIENIWESEHQKVSDDRTNLESFVEGVQMDREWFESFIIKFIEWDSNASLDIKKIPFNENKNVILPKKRVGRWLKWHSATRAQR
jgi:hypothetical protein